MSPWKGGTVHFTRSTEKYGDDNTVRCTAVFETVNAFFFGLIIAEKDYIHAAVPVEANQVLAAKSPRTEEGWFREIFTNRVQNRRRLQTNHGIPRAQVPAQVKVYLQNYRLIHNSIGIVFFFIFVFD